jgi:hypothetical protein
MCKQSIHKNLIHRKAYIHAFCSIIFVCCYTPISMGFLPGAVGEMDTLLKQIRSDTFKTPAERDAARAKMQKFAQQSPNLSLVAEIAEAAEQHGIPEILNPAVTDKVVQEKRTIEETLQKQQPAPKTETLQPQQETKIATPIKAQAAPVKETKTVKKSIAPVPGGTKTPQVAPMAQVQKKIADVQALVQPVELIAEEAVQQAAKIPIQKSTAQEKQGPQATPVKVTGSALIVRSKEELDDTQEKHLIQVIRDLYAKLGSIKPHEVQAELDAIITQVQTHGSFYIPSVVTKEYMSITDYINQSSLSEDEEKQILTKMRNLYDSRWSMLPDEVDVKLGKIEDKFKGFDLLVTAPEEYAGLAHYIDQARYDLATLDEIKRDAQEKYTEYNTLSLTLNFNEMQQYIDLFTLLLLDIETINNPVGSKLEQIALDLMLEINEYIKNIETYRDAHEPELLFNDLELQQAINKLTTLHQGWRYTTLSLNELEATLGSLLSSKPKFDEANRKKLKDIKTFYKKLYELDKDFNRIEETANAINPKLIADALKRGLEEEALDIIDEITKLIEGLNKKIQSIQNTEFSANKYVVNHANKIQNLIDKKGIEMNSMWLLFSNTSAQHRDAFITKTKQAPQNVDGKQLIEEIKEMVQEEKILAEESSSPEQKERAKILRKQMDDLINVAKQQKERIQAEGIDVKALIRQFRPQPAGKIKKTKSTSQKTPTTKTSEKQKVSTETPQSKQNAFIKATQDLYKITTKIDDLKTEFGNLNTMLKGGAVPTEVQSQYKAIQAILRLGNLLKGFELEVKKLTDQATKASAAQEATNITERLIGLRNKIKDQVNHDMHSSTNKAIMDSVDAFNKEIAIALARLEKLIAAKKSTAASSEKPTEKSVGKMEFTPQTFQEQASKLKKPEIQEKPQYTTAHGVSETQVKEQLGALKKDVTMEEAKQLIETLQGEYENLHTDVLEQKIKIIDTKLKISGETSSVQLPATSEHSLARMREYLKDKIKPVPVPVAKPTRPIKDIVDDLQKLATTLRTKVSKKEYLLDAEWATYLTEFNTLQIDIVSNKNAITEYAKNNNIDIKAIIREIKRKLEQLEENLVYENINPAEEHEEL